MKIILIVILLICIPSFLVANDFLQFSNIRDNFIEDYTTYYSHNAFGKFFIGMAAAGMLANTAADSKIQHHYQKYIRNNFTNMASETAKVFGEGKIMIPLYTGSLLLGRLFQRYSFMHSIETWGANCLQSLWVGAPSMLLMQLITGASRPSENYSHWHPFDDDNGVSGHSFMGAIPFLVAARMTNNMFFKTLFYSASAITGFSRVNDNKHYFSQALLGWWMAKLATRSVLRTPSHTVSVQPIMSSSSPGISFSYKF